MVGIGQLLLVQLLPVCMRNKEDRNKQNRASQDSSQEPPPVAMAMGGILTAAEFVQVIPFLDPSLGILDFSRNKLLRGRGLLQFTGQLFAKGHRPTFYRLPGKLFGYAGVLIQLLHQPLELPYIQPGAGNPPPALPPPAR